MAKEYLTVNGKLATNDGKFIQVHDPDKINDLLDENGAYATQSEEVANEIEDLIVKNGVIDGSPRGVYANLSALQTKYPSGASGVYLTSDNGHWYYWNGTAWTDGGVYQSAEDIKQIKKELVNVERDLTDETRRAIARENEIESLFTTPVLEQVDKWLNEHPEATTTIKDNSVTRKKLVEEMRYLTDSIKNNNVNIPKKPIISIMCDDGFQEEITIVAPILNDYNIPCTIAINTSNINLVNERLLLQNEKGWEIASHSTSSTPLTQLSLNEVDNALRNSKETLLNLGFDVKNFVYPSGYTNSNIDALVSKYYHSSCLYDNLLNNGNELLKSYAIHRIPLGAFYIGDESEVSTLEYYKSKVDEAYNNNGWVIFCLHPYQSSFNSTQQQYLRDVIEYALQLGFDFTTISKGLEIQGNLIESGSRFSSDYFVVGKNGETNLPIKKMSASVVNNETLLSNFPVDKISIEEIGNYSNAGFPTNKGGTLLTSNLTYFGFQLWFANTTGDCWFRRWTGSIWGTWVRYNKIIYSNDVINTDFIMSSNGVYKNILCNFTDYIVFNDIIAFTGTTPTLNKKLWLRNELSTDSTNPTIIGSASGKNLYVYIDNDYIYFSYNSVGNNTRHYFSITFK